MQLIGMLDSPFVRRVAVTMRLLGLEYENRPVSVLRSYDEFRTIHPLVKAPTLICEDGETLIDSGLIIDYLESLTGRSLMPASIEDRRHALQLIGVSLVAGEKVAQRIYERGMRPKEYRYTPWWERITEQLDSALDLLEESLSGRGDDQWLFGSTMTQADISVAIAWRFAEFAAPPGEPPEVRPALAAFSAKAEALPEFIACPLE